MTLTFRDGTDGLWARQQVLERLRERRAARGRQARAGALRDAHRRGVPLHAQGREGRPDEAAHPAGLGGAPDDAEGQRRGRRGELRRARRRCIQVEPRPQLLASYGLTLKDLEEAVNKGSQNASGGVLERGSRAVRHSQRGAVQAPRRHSQRGRHRARGHADSREGRGATVAESWAPRQGVVSSGSRVRRRRGHRADAPRARTRRSCSSGVQGPGRAHQPRGWPTTAPQVTPFYDRTELVERHARDGGRQPARGRAAGDAGALHLPARPARGADRGDAHSALAGGGLHLPEAAGHVGQPAVDGRGGLRRHRRRRRRHHRGHLGGAGDEGPQPARPQLERMRRASVIVVRPTVFALLIIIAAYLPIFMLERVEGRIFSPMANTVAAALAGRAALLGDAGAGAGLASSTGSELHHRESPGAEAGPAAVRADAEASRSRGRGWSSAWPRWSWSAPGWSAATLGSEFLPELNEGALYMTFTLPSNIVAERGPRAGAAADRAHR